MIHVATRCLAIFLLASAAVTYQPLYGQEKPVLVKDIVEYGFERREKAHDAGGTTDWTEVIQKPGWTLYDYSIHVISERGPGTSANVSVSDDVIVIKGKTGYERITGAGGNYQAHVKAIFVKPYRDAGPWPKDRLNLRLTQKALNHVAADAKVKFGAILTNISNEAYFRFVEAKKVALDANGGGRMPYLNSNLATNDNLLFKLEQRGDYVRIIPKVKNVALDANGGRGNPYFNANLADNDNLLFKLERHGNHHMIIPKVRQVALDANRGEGNPYFHERPDPNNPNHIWEIRDAGGGFKMLVPCAVRHE